MKQCYVLWSREALRPPPATGAGGACVLLPSSAPHELLLLTLMLTAKVPHAAHAVLTAAQQFQPSLPPQFSPVPFCDTALVGASTPCHACPPLSTVCIHSCHAGTWLSARGSHALFSRSPPHTLPRVKRNPPLFCVTEAHSPCAHLMLLAVNATRWGGRLVGCLALALLPGAGIAHHYPEILHHAT